MEMNGQFLEFVERIANAQESIAAGQAALSKQIEKFLKMHEAVEKPAFHVIAENASNILKRLAVLNKEEAITLEAAYGTNITEWVARLLASLPALLNCACEAHRYSRMMMSENQEAVSVQFDAEIVKQIAPVFVLIRDAMVRRGPDTCNKYDKAREAAIRVVAEDGPWQRNQMGAIMLIRSLFDNDTAQRTSTCSGALEQLLMIRAAASFIHTLFVNIKKA